MTQDLGDRRLYVGGSDVGAIIGVSPYCSPIELWQQKVGLAEQDVNEAMLAGSILEDSIVALYEQRTGYRTQRRNAPYVHPDYAYIQGHVDRIVVGEPGLMDAKASAYGPGYGEAGTDQVPPHVRVQMAVYLGLTGRDWCDVALLRNLRLDVYRIHHDPELYGQLVAVTVDFWTEHVLTGIPPAVDGTEGYRRFLANRFPSDSGIEMVATPEMALLIDELAGVRQDAKALETRQTLIENRIREAMGEASVLLAPGGKVTWKKNKDSARIDWKGVAEDLDAVRVSATLQLEPTGILGEGYTRLSTGELVIEWMTDADVQAVRRSSRAGNGASSPWVAHPGEMYRKTAIKRLMKRLPLGTDAETALAHEAEMEAETPTAPRPVARSLAVVREKLGITSGATSPDPEPVDDVPASPDSGDEPEDFGMVFDAADAK